MATTFHHPFAWDDSDWRDAAACRHADPDLFFPAGTTGDAVEDTAAAIALCRRCPVREECLEFAMVTNQRYGVWGATSEEDRRRMRSAWVAGRLREPAAQPGARTGGATKPGLRSSTSVGAR